MKEEKLEQSDDDASDKSSGRVLIKIKGADLTSVHQQSSPPCEDTDIADAFSKVAIGKWFAS